MKQIHNMDKLDDYHSYQIIEDIKALVFQLN